MRLVVPVRTIHAGWNRKYFGSQRGVTYYNFTSDQFAGFHGIVIPDMLRDSLFILAGLLEQQTSLNPRAIMADTHGYSEVVGVGHDCAAGLPLQPPASSALADAAGNSCFCKRLPRSAPVQVTHAAANQRARFFS
jgi:TnpA family transposase